MFNQPLTIIAMKKQPIIAGLLIVIILLTSCTSSKKMVSCPDNNKDISLIAKNNKPYKSTEYHRKDFALRKNVFARKNIERIRINNKVYSELEVSEVKVSDLSEEILLPEINNQEFYFDTKAVDITLSKKQFSTFDQVSGDNEKYQLLASNQSFSSVMSIDLHNISEAGKIVIHDEVSDVLINEQYVPLTPSISLLHKNNRVKFIDKIRKIKEDFKVGVRTLILNKPSLGFAIAAFVCSLVGLLVAALPLGIVSVVFAGIALSRVGIDPQPSSKGFAVAGLVVGIIDIVGGLILIAALL
jgi:hypothetical protein